MVISNGGGSDRYSEAPHLATSERVQQVDRLMQRRCGLVTFHFSTFAPDDLEKKALNWYGGYFDRETDGRRKWYSKIETLEAIVTPASPQHAILRGVRPFKVKEEFYFDMRFPEAHQGWTPILQVDALPSNQPNGKFVARSLQ